jgi:hypothetical protein
MSVRVEHPSVEERRAKGKEARKRTPPSSHAGWAPAAGRPDPVELLKAQDATREEDLVPVRHGRMMVSPFTFYRGAAKIMAADLKDTPRAGLTVQLCGVELRCVSHGGDGSEGPSGSRAPLAPGSPWIVAVWGFVLVLCVAWGASVNERRLAARSLSVVK